MTAATVPVRRDRALLSVSALLWGVQFAFLNPAIGIILVTLYLSLIHISEPTRPY